MGTAQATPRSVEGLVNTIQGMLTGETEPGYVIVTADLHQAVAGDLSFWSYYELLHRIVTEENFGWEGRIADDWPGIAEKLGIAARGDGHGRDPNPDLVMAMLVICLAPLPIRQLVDIAMQFYKFLFAFGVPTNVTKERIQTTAHLVSSRFDMHKQ